MGPDRTASNRPVTVVNDGAGESSRTAALAVPRMVPWWARDRQAEACAYYWNSTARADMLDGDLRSSPWSAKLRKCY